MRYQRYLTLRPSHSRQQRLWKVWRVEFDKFHRHSFRNGDGRIVIEILNVQLDLLQEDRDLGLHGFVIGGLRQVAFQ